MDRGRLKQLILEDEAFNGLTTFEQLLFFRLLVCCDDEGWITGHPDELKPILFPKWDARPNQIKTALRKLYSAGLLSTTQRDRRTSVRPTCWDWWDEKAKPGKPRKAAGTAQLSKQAEDRFNRFWEAYPRKVGKGAAQRKWETLKPDEDMTQLLIRAVEKAKKSEQWTKDRGKFIPYPATWLNQRRWEDEITVQEQPPEQLRSRGLEDWDNE